jgi:hypothetical protein
VDLNRVDLGTLRQNIERGAAVIVIRKDCLALIAPGGHVAPGTGVWDP